MDLETQYQIANAAFALLHLVYAALFLDAARRRPRVCVVRRLCALLGAFFLTGVLTNLANLSDPGPASAAQAGTFAARTVVTVALLPFVWRALRAVRTLPTPEQYQAMIAERDEAAARMRMEAQGRMAFQKQLENRNAHLRELCDAQKEQIERLRHEQVTETDYLEMRRRLHAIRNA